MGKTTANTSGRHTDWRRWPGPVKNGGGSEQLGDDHGLDGGAGQACKEDMLHRRIACASLPPPRPLQAPPSPRVPGTVRVSMCCAEFSLNTNPRDASSGRWHAGGGAGGRSQRSLPGSRGFGVRQARGKIHKACRAWSAIFFKTETEEKEGRSEGFA